MSVLQQQNSLKIYLDAFFDRNFGDDMMVRLILNQLPMFDFFIDEKSCDMVNGLSVISNLKKIEEKSFVPDVYVRIIGTGFLLGSLRAAAFELYFQMKSRKIKCPRITVGCSIEPFKNKFFEMIMRQRIKQNSFVTVRDMYSYEYMDKILKGRTAKYSDILFSIPDEWIKKEENADCLGISVMNLRISGFDEYVSKLAYSADYYIEKYKSKVLLFAFDTGEEDDLSAAESVIERMRYRDMAEIVAHDDCGDNILKGYSRCRKIVATRFHSMILALRFGIDVFPLVYAKKTENAIKDLGADICCANAEDFDINEIKNFIDKKSDGVFIDKSICEDAKNHALELKKFILNVSKNEKNHL